MHILVCTIRNFLDFFFFLISTNRMRKRGSINNIYNMNSIYFVLGIQSHGHFSLSLWRGLSGKIWLMLDWR
jgi:hypothetical protein